MSCSYSVHLTTPSSVPPTPSSPLHFTSLHLSSPSSSPLFSALGGGSSVAVTGIVVGIVAGVVVLLGSIVVVTILTFIWLKCKQDGRGSGSKDAEMWFRKK